MLGQLPYMMEQVIANALRLLMALQIFPTQEFNTWENMTVKTNPALKIFIHEAYSRSLNSMELCNMSSSLGYAPPAQNMYHVLDIGKDNNDSAADFTVTTVAAAAAAATTASRWVKAPLLAMYTLD